MKLKALAATLLAASTALPAQAGIMEDHEFLWNAIGRVGVERRINDPTECKDGYDGFYIQQASGPMMVICQTNATKPYTQVAWTANDLDTLRHEAHHIVQDCAAGRINDLRTAPIFNKQELISFVRGSGYTNAQLQSIWNSYSHKSEAVQIREIEAFAVARSVDARTIGNKVLEFCLH